MLTRDEWILVKTMARDYEKAIDLFMFDGDDELEKFVFEVTTALNEHRAKQTKGE